MEVEIRLYHLSGMSLVNTMIGVANLLIYGEVIDKKARIYLFKMPFFKSKFNAILRSLIQKMLRFKLSGAIYKGL